jgi:sporulation protein YlmC with PRC-barrel domain
MPLASGDQLEETVQTDIDPRSLIGRKAFDSAGTKIGTVDEVYLDDATGAPEWAAVRTGLFSRDAFVPLEPSEVVGEALRVPFDRALIRQAPDFGVGRHLSPEQELQLYHHYGLDVPGSETAASGGDFGRLASPPEDA